MHSCSPFALSSHTPFPFSHIHSIDEVLEVSSLSPSLRDIRALSKDSPAQGQVLGSAPNSDTQQPNHISSLDAQADKMLLGALKRWLLRMNDKRVERIKRKISSPLSAAPLPDTAAAPAQVESASVPPSSIPAGSTAQIESSAGLDQASLPTASTACHLPKLKASLATLPSEVLL